MPTIKNLSSLIFTCNSEVIASDYLFMKKSAIKRYKKNAEEAFKNTFYKKITFDDIESLIAFFHSYVIAEGFKDIYTGLDTIYAGADRGVSLIECSPTFTWLIYQSDGHRYDVKIHIDRSNRSVKFKYHHEYEDTEENDEIQFIINTTDFTDLPKPTRERWFNIIGILKLVYNDFTGNMAINIANDNIDKYREAHRWVAL